MATQLRSAPVESNENDATAWPSDSWLILFVGVVIYGMLCQPAIRHGGRGALDPIWSAIPWLWIVPLLVYEIFDRRPFLSKMWLIAAYAIATAFFFSGTLGSSIPRFVSLGAMVLGAFVLGPIHTSLAFAISAIWQVGRRTLSTRFAPGREAGWVGKLAATSLVLGVAITFLFVYRDRAYAMATQSAKEAADRRWISGDVFLIADGMEQIVEHRGKSIQRFVDPGTGLPISSRGWPRWGIVNYRRIYNGRVQELIAEHGLPSSSLKADLVSDDDLVAMLDSPDMSQVEAFPYRVNEHVTVERVDGTLQVQTQDADACALTDATWSEYRFEEVNGPVYAGRSSQYPQVTFLRRGKEWIGAYHANGALLSAAYDLPSRSW